jgi:ribonuclease D
MGYVALSRVRSLGGVYLSGINQMALQLHPDIFEFDRALQRASASLADTTLDAPDEEPSNEDETGEADYDQELFRRLREWRLARAKSDQVAPFIIAHDSTLQELARRRPTTMQKLGATKGFGPKKVASYGSDILQIISDYTGTATQPKWNADANAELLRHFHAGTPLTDLAKQFGASPEELWQHLSDLLK